MVRNIPIGQFIPGESFVHRLDPRTKISVIMLYIVILFVADHLAAYMLLLVLLLAAIAATGLSPRIILRGMRSILFLIVLTVVLNTFMTGGTPIATLGPLTVTREGLRQGAFMGGRLIMLITATSIMTLTTSPIDLTDGLERMMKPFQRIGVPAHELAMMMTIALRFIPTLMEEADKIMKAQMARGADFESGNVLHRARSLVPLLVPLFVSAFRRADELALAMEARCYRGGQNRTRMRQLRMGVRDAAAAMLSAGVAGGVIAIRLVL